MVHQIKSIQFQLRVRLTFMTGVAGRVTVLMVDAELLLAATADDAGGMAATLMLLVAPFALFATPATQSRRSQTNRLGHLAQESVGGRHTYLFWLPCTCRSCPRSRPRSGSSPQRRRRHRHLRR